jgi:secreted trypsin-like serine protease
LGWRFQMTQYQYADALLLVNVTIYSYAECIRMKYKPSAISGYMLCAGNVNRDICQGDTSGPLVIRNEGKWEIVGVTSWNEKCGSPGYPQVYTKLLHYVDWICSQMRIMKVENVECHCALIRPATCPSCGMGYNGRIEEVEADCGVSGNAEHTFFFNPSIE